MLDKILKSTIVKSFIKCAKSGKLNGHYNKNPLGMLESNEVIFSFWSEEYFDELDESSSLSLALLSILRHNSFSIGTELYIIFDQCGSLIEKMFLSALICACNNKEIGLAVYSEDKFPYFEDLLPYTSSLLHIHPSKKPVYPRSCFGHWNCEAVLPASLRSSSLRSIPYPAQAHWDTIGPTGFG